MKCSRRIVHAILALAFAALPAAAQLQTPEARIDCDRGGNLQSAVTQLAARGGGIVYFRGTCNRVSIDSEYIEIVGDTPATSKIKSEFGAAVSASGPGFLRISNAHLMASEGLRASGAGREVFVNDSEIDGGFIGLLVGSGAAALIEDTSVSGTEIAARADSAVLVVERSVLSGATFGAQVLQSEVFLIDTEVTGNQIGVNARDRSTVQIESSRFAENGSMHLAVSGGSTVDVIETVLGAADDPTPVSMQLTGRSSIGIYVSEIWGSATVFDDSFVNLTESMLNGFVALRRFSKLYLNGTVTDGTVDCQTGGDATCDYLAAATTRGCANAPDQCQPLPGEARRDPGPEQTAPEPRARFDRSGKQSRAPRP